MKKPDFSYEQNLWKKGISVVGGCDEVGRGCFAGSVVASTVVFAPNMQYTKYNTQVKIDDSKKLTEKQRIVADKWIRENCLAFGIGEANVSLINKIGIVRSTEVAMRKSIKNCEIEIEHLLIDAFYVPRTKDLNKNKQTAIVKGDSLSLSIASASIIAKVYRDSLMIKIGSRKQFAKYEWYSNKGYGTKVHREAILKHGITKHHRVDFVNTFLSKLNAN